MTVDEILRLTGDEIARMSRRELARVTKVLADAGNKRLKRLSTFSAQQESMAYADAMESGGKFTTAKKTVNQLRNEFKRVKTFLKDKTSTVKGWEAYRQKTFSKLGLSKSQIQEFEDKDFWSKYRKMSKEIGAGALKEIGSDVVQQYIVAVQSGKMSYTRAKERLDDLYESREEFESSLYDEWEKENEDEWEGYL